jgi:hypothetical protein
VRIIEESIAQAFIPGIYVSVAQAFMPGFEMKGQEYKKK